MKTLIIPDVHTQFYRAEAIIDLEEPDKVVFLGDYFDAFGDGIDQTFQTAEWLKWSMKKTNRIHLMGNHDLAYINRDYVCSGYSEGKLYAIKNAECDLSKLQHYTWVDDWLCTHAGLSYELYKAFAGSGDSVSNFIEKAVSDDALRHRLYGCSSFRGGRDAHAGIVWCDYSEFVPIPDTKQIFGHTRSDSVRRLYIKDEGSDTICLDTGLNNYAIYDGETMEVKIVG